MTVIVRKIGPPIPPTAAPPWAARLPYPPEALAALAAAVQQAAGPAGFRLTLDEGTQQWRGPGAVILNALFGRDYQPVAYAPLRAVAVAHEAAYCLGAEVIPPPPEPVQPGRVY
ncbi:MAG TPA: hypothetical protein VLD58_14200 [Gemmatimonadales bacterium]|nr:hypothetical protein [Gemmatimonadales bacterium]